MQAAEAATDAQEPETQRSWTLSYSVNSQGTSPLQTPVKTEDTEVDPIESLPAAITAEQIVVSDESVPQIEVTDVLPEIEVTDVPPKIEVSEAGTEAEAVEPVVHAEVIEPEVIEPEVIEPEVHEPEVVESAPVGAKEAAVDTTENVEVS